MTNALLCDGCGRLVSDADPTDDDPARRWWSLSLGPTPGGRLLTLQAALEIDVEEEAEGLRDAMETQAPRLLPPSLAATEGGRAS